MVIRKYIFFGYLLFAAQISVAQTLHWHQTNGPYQGTILCFASTDHSLFAGTYNGVFRSTDNGISWNIDSIGIGAPSVTAFAASGDTVYAGTSYNAGLFKSTDGGDSWVKTSLSFYDEYINSLLIAGKSVFAGTNYFYPNYSFFRSVDDGVTWSEDNIGIPQEVDIQSLILSGKTIFAGGYATGGASGVWKSVNKGNSWTKTGSIGGQQVNALAISGTTIFAATGDSGVYRSTNNGAIWIQHTSGMRYSDSSALGVLCLAIIDTTIFAGGYGGLYRSTDNGATWSETDAGLGQTVYSLFVIGHQIFAGTSVNGIFMSSDKGVTWFQSGTEYTQVKALATYGSTVLSASIGGIHQSSNNGAAWSQTAVGPTHYDAIAIQGSTMFADNPGYGVYRFRTTDSGASWNRVGDTASHFSEYGSTLATNGSVIYQGTWSNGIFRSTDDGNTWDSLSLSAVTYVEAMTTRGSVVIAALNGEPYISTDDGDSWNKSGLNYGYTTSVALAGTDIFAGTAASGIWHSSDLGLTWNPVNNHLTSYAVSAMLYYDNVLYAGTLDSGVYFSNDNGANWNSVRIGLSNLVINDLAIAGGSIYAATNTGVFRASLNDLSAPQSEAERKDDFAITVSPNPFSRETTIKFHVPIQGDFQVSMYNLLGEEVAKLFSGVLESGEHAFIWDAAGMASGLYECLIRLNGRIEKVSLVILK